MSEIKITPPDEQIVEVTSVGVMAALMVKWQQEKIALLTHLKAIPPGTEVSQDDVQTMILNDDALAGFQLGISLALEELSTLPFSAIEDNVPEEPSNTPNPGGNVEQLTQLSA